MKQTQPFVSVLMPFYNQEKYLERAVLSVLRQSLQNIEVILCNDGSCDSSLSIAKRLADQDSRIKLITFNENHGSAAALEKALALASAPLIARHDTDDWSLPDRLEKQCNFLIDNPSVTACGTFAYDVFLDGHKELLVRETSDAAIKIDGLFEIPLLTTSLLVRAPFFHKHGCETKEPRVCGDYCLFAHHFTAYTFANIPEPLMNKQVHYDSSTQSLPRQTVIDADLFAKKTIIEKLGFAPTTEELRLHNNLTKMSEAEMKNNRQIHVTQSNSAVTKWKEKLLSFNAQARVFDQKLLTEALEMTRCLVAA